MENAKIAERERQREKETERETERDREDLMTNNMLDMLITKFLYTCIYIGFCAIWYHLYNLKKVKNSHVGVLLLVKLQALKPETLLKVTLLHECF